EWLAVGDAQGQAKGARITAALPLEEREIEHWFGARMQRRSILRWNAGRVEARLERRLGAITLASAPDPTPDLEAVVDLLVVKAVENLGEFVPAALLARARFARIDALALSQLADDAADWLVPLLHGRRDLAVPKAAIADALLARLSWEERQRLDTLAPREFASPAGTHHSVD